MNRRGFTSTELLIVIVVISVAAALVYWKSEPGPARRIKDHLESYVADQSAYHYKHGSFDLADSSRTVGFAAGVQFNLRMININDSSMTAQGTLEPSSGPVCTMTIFLPKGRLPPIGPNCH